MNHIPSLAGQRPTWEADGQQRPIGPGSAVGPDRFVKSANGKHAMKNSYQERMMMTALAHATTVEVRSSHVACMSHPAETARLIEATAATSQ